MSRFGQTANDYIEVDLSALTLPLDIRALFVAGGATEEQVAGTEYGLAIAIVAVDGPGYLTLINSRGHSRGPMAFAAGEFNYIMFTKIAAASGVTRVKVYV